MKFVCAYSHSALEDVVVVDATDIEQAAAKFHAIKLKSKEEAHFRAEKHRLNRRKKGQTKTGELTDKQVREQMKPFDPTKVSAGDIWILDTESGKWFEIQVVPPPPPPVEQWVWSARPLDQEDLEDEDEDEPEDWEEVDDDE